MSNLSRRVLARYAANQLEAGVSARTLAKQLAACLVEAKQTTAAQYLLSDIHWELEHRRALSVGQVTSAHAISKELESALKTRIKKATSSREVLLEKTIDESVLGGLRVETSGRVWDLTLARKLTDLREAF